MQITLTDGSVIDYHPSFKFSEDVFRKFKPEDKVKLFDDRAKYKRQRMMKAVGIVPYDSQNNNSGQQQPQYQPYFSYPQPNAHYINQLGSSSQPPPLPPPPAPTLIPPPPSSLSGSANSSLMGGRNLQIGDRHYQGGRPS